MDDITATPLTQVTGLSEYDSLELLGFMWKVENEGYAYAEEHYAPEFENDAPKQEASTDDGLRGLYQKHRDALERWQENTDYNEVERLWIAHLREETERRDKANGYLWAVHPGGTWNYHPYSKAFESRERAQQHIDYWDGRLAKGESSTWRLLHRETVDSEWTEVQA